MSYSRWSNSDWYTFWYATDSKVRDEQRLAIWHVTDEDEHPSFTFAQLVKVATIEQLAELLPKRGDYGIAALGEALLYVRQWLTDVRERYP